MKKDQTNNWCSFVALDCLILIHSQNIKQINRTEENKQEMQKQTNKQKTHATISSKQIDWDDSDALQFFSSKLTKFSFRKTTSQVRTPSRPRVSTVTASWSMNRTESVFMPLSQIAF